MNKNEKSFFSIFRKDIFTVLISLVLLVIVWIVTGKYSMPVKWLIPLMFLVPYLLSGYEIFMEALEKLLRGELLDEDFLMTVASAGAMLLGDYPEAISILLLYRVGECFEHYAVVKSRRSVAELMDIRPEYACVERNGRIVRVDPASVRVGSVITVSPGERVPLDGVVLDGESSVDTSALTGEAMPRSVGFGSEILSGCVNTDGVLHIKTTSSYKNSTVAKILDLVESAAESRSEHENMVTRFARVYTPVVVILALMIGLVPPLITGLWADWLRRALIFLVISCPCALVISVPLSFFGGIGCASRNGILVKGPTCLEALCKVGAVVMDKTGTVTEGSFTVTEVMPVSVSSDELLMLAAAAESYSNHPIAVSLRNACRSLPDSSLVTNVRENPGRGVEATVCGRSVLVGNAALMASNGIPVPDVHSNATIVHVAANGSYGGYIVIDDRIKDGAKQAIRELYSLGAGPTVMLTGDNEATAQTVGSALNVNKVFAGLLPEDKVIAVRELTDPNSKTKLVFMGDGLNDAPVLAAADIGVSMGIRGADAAIEASQIVIMDDDLRKLPLAIRIARRTVGIARQNIFLSLLCKLAVLVLGAFGLAGMWLAVFADVGVLILVIINALRTFRI